MAFSVGLLIKGLAGLGAAAGAVSLGVIYGVDWDPHLLKLSFRERLKQKVGNFFGDENSDKLCKKQRSSGQDKNPERYTCDANDTLKNALKFTTDGTNELKIKDQLKREKIEIRENPDTNNFPFGIMLVWENVISEITLQEKTGNTDTKTFKKKTFPEFKLENGKFKHAWTIKTLGEKVGLDCQENDPKTCTLKSGSKINVWEREETDGVGRGEIKGRVEDVTFEGSLNFEEDVEGYSQGFKLTVTNDIPLKKDGNQISGSEVTKISGTTNSYEIKYQESLGKWYLSKHQ